MNKLNKVQVLMPQYMKNFKCIGGKCEDSCCVGWTVSIDKDTYKKYRSNTNVELKELLYKNIKRWRSKGSHEEYAKVILKDNKSCPFLDENKFCKIHSILGEESLSSTCKIYPINYNKIDDTLEKSATLSCIEAARLALLNPDPMEFDFSESEQNDNHLIKTTIKTNDTKFDNKLKKYFWEIRIFTINLLQNRVYKLWERIVILGIVSEKIEELLKNNEIDKIPVTLGTYSNCIEKGEFHEYLKQIPSNNSIQMVIVKALADKRYVMGITSERYVECFAEFMKGIEYIEDRPSKDIIKSYEEAYKNYYKACEEKYEYIIENYLVNYIFENIFPLNKKSIFESYIMFVVNYSLIKMNLIGMSAFHKENFSEEHIVKLIQSFTKTVNHNSMFLKSVYEIICENNLSTLAYMTILVKN